MQLFFSDSLVFTPKDGDNWLFAKLNVQAAEFGYSQVIEHLVNVHLLMEPICVALKRHFPSQHPLHQMLKFHCREILIPNVFGVPNLVGEAQFLHKLSAFGNLGAKELIKRVFPVTSWDLTDFRGSLKVAVCRLSFVVVSEDVVLVFCVPYYLRHCCVCFLFPRNEEWITKKISRITLFEKMAK